MTDGPIGDVIQTPVWFTHCVDKSEYHNPVSFGVDAGLATMGKDGCDYLLGRKLVCLDGTRCAIGTVIHIEPVGYHKSGFEQIDNDFCINVLLFPHEVGQFGPGTGATDKISNWNEVKGDHIQGALIEDQALGLTPNEPATGPTPYAVTYLFGVPGGPSPYEPNEDPTERKLEEVKQDASGIHRIDIPVLHAEFEGSRIFAVCNAIRPFLDAATGGPGPGACRAAIGWIPFFGDAVCTLVESLVALALAPAMAAAAAAAWTAAGIADDAFLTGPISRQISLGEPVIITGRWTWDGGHSGWNEFHPTFTLQKIVFPDKVTAGYPHDEAKAFVDRWCDLVMGVPPPTGEAATGLTAMTPEQQETLDRQRRPENGWGFHPAIDGCLPSDDDGQVDIR
jgi:hypothetical protein